METFLRHADSYHPIARKMIAADLNIQGGAGQAKKSEKRVAALSAPCKFKFPLIHVMLLAGGLGIIAVCMWKRSKSFK